MKTFYLLLVMQLQVLVFTNAIAQDSTHTKGTTRKVTTIKMKDGTIINGVLLATTEQEIRIQTDNLGELVIVRENIESMEENQVYYQSGKLWFQNPHSTRYLFAPSAYTLSKGEGYYQNAYLFVNSVSVGVTDHFTMGGGMVLNPTFRDWQVLFLTPKVSFPSKSKVKFGLGVMAVGVFSTRYDYSTNYKRTKSGIKTDVVGMGYGTMTVGNPNSNFSVGLGWAFSNSDGIGSNPTINLSYMGRFAKKVGFVTENWIITGKDGLTVLSGGLRFFGEKMAVDLALLVPAGELIGEQFIAIPYVDFVLKFGQKKGRF